MMNSSRIQSDEMIFNIFLRSVLHLLTQQKSRYSSIDTSPTQQVVMPFDLGDVAQAFSGSFALRFAHLEDQSNN